MEGIPRTCSEFIEPYPQGRGLFCFLWKTQIVSQNWNLCRALCVLHQRRGLFYWVETCSNEWEIKGEKEMKNPGTAAVLSFLIPGVGQIYNGTFWRAIFWLIITPGLWIGSGGT